MAERKICAVDGCEKPYHAHGYCARHAAKHRAYGDPLAGRDGPSPGEPLRWIAEHTAYSGDDCIRWPYEVTKYGYGTVKHNGKKRVASRVMCEAAHGPPPSPEHQAAHSCGNGHLACMTPRHLSWKTPVENMGDAIAHGTWNHGESVPCAKLTEGDVREIRRLAGSMSQQHIADRFGVQANNISRIIARKRWAWLD